MCEISVAIASYNVAQYIEQCLLSVLNQDFEDYEVLVCDDCSTDNSLSIVKRLIQHHPKGNIVRIVSCSTNMGTAVVRNNGIDNAKGKYIFFVDGDDYISANALSILYAKMQETDVDLVMGDIEKFVENPDGSVTVNKNPYKYQSDTIKSPYAIAECMRRNHTDFYPLGTVNKLFKKSFLIDNNIRCVPEHSIIEDIYFVFQTIVKANSISVVEDVTMYYRQRVGSALHIDVREDRMNIYIQVFDQIVNDIQKMKNQGLNVPVQLYYTLTNRYISGFVTRNIVNSKLLSKKQKKDYLNHISVITRMGIGRKDMIGKSSKICFGILSLGNRYLLLKWFFGLRVFILSAIRRIRHL